MLDTIAATSEEVAGTAGITAGLADTLRNRFQIDIVIGVARVTRRFAISTRGIVTDQAINIFFSGKVKTLVFPAITDMARCTVRIVGLWRDAEVIENVLLAQALLVLRVQEVPGPVLGLVNLPGGF